MKRNNRKVMRNKKKRVQSQVQRLRPGTINSPPDNSGTVQIPRPIVARAMILKRTFKLPITIMSTASASAYYAFSLYAPFIYTANGSAVSNLPSDYTSTLGAFGVYKVKQIQLILQPLLISTTIPSPYVTAMVLEGNAPPTSSVFNYATLSSYTNAQQISPAYPTEVRYIVPTLASAAGTADLQVLKGGWLPSQAGAYANNLGYLVLSQTPTPYVASTNFSLATIVYEVWFKNPV